jgi:hypothetical protein
MPPDNERRIRWLCVAGLAGVFGYFLVYIYVRLSHGEFGDFSTFYQAAQAMRDGRNPYVWPEPPPPALQAGVVGGMAARAGAFREGGGRRRLRLGGQPLVGSARPVGADAHPGTEPYEGDRAYVYPPLLAYLYMPLTAVSKLNAARIVLPINVLCALAAILIAARAFMRRFGVTPITATGVLAVALLASALGENELRGQLQSMETDALMLLLFTLALHWLDDRPLTAGAMLAAALNIKYLSIVLLPYLLLRRRWRAAAGMVIGAVAFALLPAIVVGWHNDIRYLKIALGGLLGWVGHQPAGGAATVAKVHAVADGVSVSLTSAMARYLRDHGRSQAGALVGAMLLAACGLAATWLLYAWRHRPLWRWPAAREQRNQPWAGLVGLEWLGLVAATLAFSPNTNTRHLILALLLEVAAAVMLLIPRPGVGRLWLLVGTIVMVVGFILPLHGLLGTPFTHYYFRYSIVSWCLLLMYFTLLYTGLAYLRGSSFGSAPPGHR